MVVTEFQRETKGNKPVIALCYDFDKTLSPDDMQAQGYIQTVQSDGQDMVGDFWRESNGLATDNDMDKNLAYMYTMKKKARGQLLFTKEKLVEYGSKVELFSGVDNWFERIRKYGEDRGIIIEHYIISSGLKEMIEGTSIAKSFKEIYATSFYFDDDGVAVWPAQVVNYTNKTQFLFRISKGVLDVNDEAVNDSFAPDEIRIPFRNMIYFGDSDTDIPCMKLVNSHGGYSIGVYNPDENDERKAKNKVYKMIKDNRISYFASADYSENSELDELVKLIIDKTVYNEKLYSKMFANKKEAITHVRPQDEQEKADLIDALESSGNFKNTHSVIRKLSKFTNWQPDEIEDLFSIAKINSQVRYILEDKDIKDFYEKLFEEVSPNDKNAIEIREILNKKTGDI
ncbi:haloacid dehalogenase-like hydrolase [Streptococcus chenjunshii]|uniref:Haloacid dehalogenase-like hydrolase n=1 Tax=Streptococcus chenjunshii TaxID=2173853 RepID=A0A372KMF3_9STRE|nr:HAD family hydrolase [Streptococcus chenjunshii]AXQ79625.1 haloacid dehalogenase-like hydrolase [Streptococcus chenjunshii]RFU51060.1 haloacid dehalogenase-like hydrolase [Streptococcus chenjunshii]RFU53104.1 haloacid dehalogenase-like hydrolase [Streptococcus chenjunshii]